MAGPTPSDPLAAPAEPPPPPSGTVASSPSLSVVGVVWPVLLSLGVLALVGYYTFDLQAFRQMARSVHLGYLGAAIACSVLQVLLGGWRLHLLAAGRLARGAAMRVQLAYHFFANVTPSTVGGGPPTAYYMARDLKQVSLGEASALLLFSMLLDQLWVIVLIPLLLAASFFFPVFPTGLGDIGAWTIAICFALMLAWAVLFAYTMLVRPDLLERLAGQIFRLPLLRRFRDRVMQEMHRLRRHARLLRLQPPLFYVRGFALTVAFWLSRYLIVVFVVWSVYPTLDVALASLRSAAMTLGSLVLPTPGGAGGAEGLYALFVGPLMPQALVAPTLLTWRLLGYYLFLPTGAYLTAHFFQRKVLARNAAPSDDEAPPDGPAPPDEAAHSDATPSLP